MTISRIPACRKTLENISAYLDGELDATACDAIERHSLECQGCMDLLNGLRKTIGLCRDAGGISPPEAVRERASRAVRQLLDQGPQSAE